MDKRDPSGVTPRDPLEELSTRTRKRFPEAGIALLRPEAVALARDLVRAVGDGDVPLVRLAGHEALERRLHVGRVCRIQVGERVERALGCSREVDLERELAV